MRNLSARLSHEQIAELSAAAAAVELEPTAWLRLVTTPAAGILLRQLEAGARAVRSPPADSDLVDELFPASPSPKSTDRRQGPKPLSDRALTALGTASARPDTDCDRPKAQNEQTGGQRPPQEGGPANLMSLNATLVFVWREEEA